MRNKSNRILVTGGLGFIGSHTVSVLCEKGYEPIIVDDLSNSSREVHARLEKLTGRSLPFYELDLSDDAATATFFSEVGSINGVIHFAAFKAVGESVREPLKYYRNNLQSLFNVLKGCSENAITNFVFSSSCTVYGESDEQPISENAPVQQAFSPYGNTKQIGEEILFDVSKSEDNLHVVALRYFNPIGAHPSGEIGELPIGVPQNLVPYITQTAIGIREELSVFGDDYPTRDGTAIRDYIHVMDLAEAHVVAIEWMQKRPEQSSFDVFNIGTGEGSTVLEVIHAFEKATGQNLNYKIALRRSGDVTEAYANTKKAESTLGWKAHRSLEDALRDAWNWEQKLNQK
jgi:UDP-glucose 4-epimerase